jgi:hypothetical protein
MVDELDATASAVADYIVERRGSPTTELQSKQPWQLRAESDSGAPTSERALADFGRRRDGRKYAEPTRRFTQVETVAARRGC